MTQSTWRGHALSLSPSDGQSVGIIDLYSYQQWQLERHNVGSASKQALLALVRELFEELEPDEQAVLRGMHIEGKREAAVAREMGLHHSNVHRLRLKAEDKLRSTLTVVLRFQQLEREYSWSEW